MAMAVEAPAHGQRRRLPHQRHPIDGAVTGRATDALRDVNAVIEIDVVGKNMDPLPVNRLVASQAFPDRRQHRRIGPELRMTCHAGYGGRNARKTRGRHRGVAIAAIKSQAADVVGVTEWHRLLPRNRLICDVRRSHQRIADADEQNRGRTK